jgi:hypothetical protein
MTELKEQHNMRYLFVPELMQFSQKYFDLNGTFSWMNKTAPNYSDWLAVSVFVKK